MTVQELEHAPPQAAAAAQEGQSSHSDDLESLVRALAEQANAADKRSAELAERVALLEDRRGVDDNGPPAADEAAARDRPQARWLGSKRVAFAGGTKDGSRRESNDASTHSATNFAGDGEDNLKSVVGVPEDDPEEALSDRILLIERRLEDYEEEKGANALDERKYALPESTFSLLITHHPLSVPFAFAVFSVALSILILSLTLASSIQNGTRGNRLGIPAGVSTEVRAAQFLGAIVGVLMEEEIPQGLQLIANAAGHTLLLNGRKPVHKRVIISSIFRLFVGYLFLASLFMNIAQNSDVLEILYDVLALEFVENIDDTTYALAKKGFFGRHMLVATNQPYNLNIEGEQRRSLMVGSTASIMERRLSFSGVMASNNRVNHIVRSVYFLNAAIILAGLAFVAVSQDKGKYRCNTINVLFDEEVWENALVIDKHGRTEERLLIYPYFNGIYKEDGQLNGYPRYVEQNKNDGDPFGPTVTGAEIIFCEEIGSWVFMHRDIISSENAEEVKRWESSDSFWETGNECQWLMKSYPTDEYDILSTNNLSWEARHYQTIRLSCSSLAWVGEVKPHAQVSITCNEGCSEKSDCNYRGECVNDVCYCDETHFGEFCEFEVPCEFLASEKAQRYVPGTGLEWNQDNPIELWGELHKVYNRPVYIQKGLSGEPFDMRLYKILEKEISTAPSDRPSISPSTSNGPTAKPTDWPTYAGSPTVGTNKTFAPTTFAPKVSPVVTSFPTDVTTPSVGTNKTLAPTPAITRPKAPGIPELDSEVEVAEDDFWGEPVAPLPSPYVSPTTAAPTTPRHTQNEYDTAPDFADFDDFFESPRLHDLDEILTDYAVAISYSGSRFFGTIIEPNETIEGLFPADYHSFWSQSFDVNRTFIISDPTLTGSPVGLDFYEMRRRINNLRNDHVQFSYGPYGALIPLMDYEGTGFFHCLDVTAQPSGTPSISGAPTATTSPTQTPTDECFFVDINIVPDWGPNQISWAILSLAPADEIVFVEGSLRNYMDWSKSTETQTRRECLPGGDYRFYIMDSASGGIFAPGYYNVTTSDGVVIAFGGGEYSQYGAYETAEFSLPLEAAPFPDATPVDSEGSIVIARPEPTPDAPPSDSEGSVAIARPLFGENCAALDPNPDDFEGGTFPSPPWSTGGSGDWALATDNAFSGTNALKSPDLAGMSEAVSNATLTICDDFTGGLLRFQAIASVAPPWDIFHAYVDGERVMQLVDVNEWTEFSVMLSPGPHRVEFSYFYNLIGVDALPPSQAMPQRQGAVWIDMVQIL